MRKKTATALLVAGLITGGGGAALVAPGAALAAESSTSSSATDRAAARLSAIKGALTGLVTDGTLTQDQADEVATTLAESDLGHGHGGRHRGGHVSTEATAAVLGITVEELRTAQEAGQTLAQIAEANGVSRADLVDGLVAAAQEELAEEVTEGDLTQAEADEKSASLAERIEEQVDRVGHDGHHGRGDDADDDTDGTDEETPEAATPSPSATS